MSAVCPNSFLTVEMDVSDVLVVAALTWGNKPISFLQDIDGHHSSVGKETYTIAEAIPKGRNFYLVQTFN